MTRRIVLTVLLALGLTLSLAFEVGPVAAEADRDPTTEATTPDVAAAEAATVPLQLDEQGG